MFESCIDSGVLKTCKRNEETKKTLQETKSFSITGETHNDFSNSAICGTTEFRFLGFLFSLEERHIQTFSSSV